MSVAFRLVLLTLCLAGAVHAQVPGITVTTEPASPTVSSSVTIVVTSECGCPGHLTPIVRNGFTFDVPYNTLCLAACAPTDVASYAVGVLEPGIYTVRHVPDDDSSAPVVIGTFAVVGAAIPALSFGAMVALALALTAIGVVVLRR
ncbi:MAG: hypothetical protein ACXW5U_23390 [Thermoanaerobaculia bacterium]